MTETVDSAPEVESPSTEEVPVDAPESPSEVEPEAETEEPEASPAAKAAEEEAEPEEWKNLLKKFGGDKDKAGKAFWKALNDNSVLAKEAKEAKARLTELEKQEKSKASKADNATLKEVDSRIAALTNELTGDQKDSLPSQEIALFVERENIKKDIAVLEYQLKSAEELDKRAIQSDLKTANLLLKMNTRDITDIKNRSKLAEHEIERLKSYKAQVEHDLDEQRANQEKADEVRAAFDQEFPDEIERYTNEFCDEFKVPADEREDVRDTVFEHLMAFAARFRGQGEDADKDWRALVRARVQRESVRIERAGKSKFNQVSKEIRKTVPNGKPAAPAKPAATKTPEIDDGLTPGMRAARLRWAQLERG